MPTICQTLKAIVWALWLELNTQTSGGMLLCIYKEGKAVWSTSWMRLQNNSMNYTATLQSYSMVKFASLWENWQSQTKKNPCRRKQVMPKSLKISSILTGRKTDFKPLHSFLSCIITFLRTPQNESMPFYKKYATQKWVDGVLWSITMTVKYFFNCDNNV